MEEYISKSALVTEIKRRKQVAFGWMETAPNDAIEAEFELCDDILSFLDTLEVKEVDLDEEPVSEDLEEASKEWLRPQLDKSYANYGETKMMELTHFDGYAMLDAIEFGAKWGKNQAKAEIQAQSMALAHGCPKEEPANESLNEAAIAYNKKVNFVCVGEILNEYFIAGAQWQKEQDKKTIELAEDHAMFAGMEKMKEQMMEKAIETTFNVSLPSGLYDKLWIKGCKDGDKLLVIKKDEL